MPLRLMIVEDDEPLVELLRYNFEAAGYTVETVMHGDEAEARLQGSRSGSADPRLDAAGIVRHRALPSAAAEAQDAEACRSSC